MKTEPSVFQSAGQMLCESSAEMATTTGAGLTQAYCALLMSGRRQRASRR